MIKSDFVLEPINKSFCNLKLLETKTKRTGVTIEEFGDTLYGIPIEIALRKIVTLRTSKNFNGTLTEYLKKWKEEAKVLESLREELRLECLSENN